MDYFQETATEQPTWIGPAQPGERARLASGRPKVSIVTPSFNQARFLEQTIRSVLDQNYADLEYIVIDGGSTDGSVDIIRRYADRLAYWVSERDAGQTDALNKGFARATGDIVAWVNSDDFYYPGAFDAAVAAFRANPNLGLLYGRGNRVSEDGEIICEFEATRPFNLEALVYGIDYILQPTTFMQRQALHEVGPFDRCLHYAFDWELWMRLGKRFPASMVDRVIAAGREYPAAKTFTGGFPRAEEIRRLVAAHTGKDLSVGYLAYYLHTVLESLPRAQLADSGRIRDAIGQVIGLCQELLSEDRLREGAQPPMIREIPPYADGWVGPVLQVRRVIPEAATCLCLRGMHDSAVAAAVGPLVLHASLDGRPLGTGVALIPGPFTNCWLLPPDSRGHESLVTITAAATTTGTQLRTPSERRRLAFHFTELSFEASPPPGVHVASDGRTSAVEEVQRAYRQIYSSTEPYADGWVGPVLRLTRPVPGAAHLVCLAGTHETAIANVVGPLRLWATLNGRPLGGAVVTAPGPFTLCWPLPSDRPEALREAVQKDRAADQWEVIITSATSIVPSHFWPSADARSLAFRFVDLTFESEAPAGAQVVREGADRSGTVLSRARRMVSRIFNR